MHSTWNSRHTNSATLNDRPIDEDYTSPAPWMRPNPLSASNSKPGKVQTTRHCLDIYYRPMIASYIDKLLQCSCNSEFTHLDEGLINFFI